MSGGGIGDFLAGPPPSGGIGSFASASTPPAGSPTLNPSKGVTSFQDMYAASQNRPAPTPTTPSSPTLPPAGGGTFQDIYDSTREDLPPGPTVDYWVGSLQDSVADPMHYVDPIGRPVKPGDAYAVHYDNARSYMYVMPDGRVAVPSSVPIFRTASGGKGLDWFLKDGYEKVKMNASLSPAYTGDPSSPFSYSNVSSNPDKATWTKTPPKASWERNGFADGGVVEGGMDPGDQKMYMGAMMALDPNSNLSEDDRNEILSIFEDQYGPEALDGIASQMSGPQESDGMSDSIPAVINGSQPAALSEDEFVIPADVVSGLGRGSTNAGARKLMAMIDQVRSQSANLAKTRPGPKGK